MLAEVKNLLLLAQTFENKDDFDGALFCLNMASAFDSSLPKIHNQKGLLLLKKGKLNEAIECFNEVISLKPTDYEAYELKASCLYVQRNFGEALKCYNKMIELNPNCLNPYIYKEECGEEMERLMASGNIENLELYDSGYVTANFTKGGCLMGLGRYQEALECFEKAIELDPNHHNSKYNRVLALSALGRVKESGEYATKIADDFEIKYFGRTLTEMRTV